MQVALLKISLGQFCTYPNLRGTLVVIKERLIVSLLYLFHMKHFSKWTIDLSLFQLISSNSIFDFMLLNCFYLSFTALQPQKTVLAMSTCY